jgi:LL-diaminopimelate aminotransferase
MATVNENYLNLNPNYLFPEIARRVREFQQQNPDAKLIRMGIGDVTEPLPAACLRAMHRAVDELGDASTFRGYGPEQGYEFLRRVIAEQDFRARGCDIDPGEIFVSDGSKPDNGNILDIFAVGSQVAVTDPVYPVYVDTNVMQGNAGRADGSGRHEGIVYLPATPENGFRPPLPDRRVDLVYLCSPNNPTGAVLDRTTLTRFVDWAVENGAVLFFDAAYEAFIRPEERELPRSIYEIPNARRVAIEFRSFSKTAGFTGVRAGYTVVPRELEGRTRSGEQVPLHRLWLRRHSTKFNGISYITQRACEAVYSEEGRAQVRELVGHYMRNAGLIRSTLTRLGFEVYGGVDAPYAWVRVPEGKTSWQYFDILLRNLHIVCTPGVGFGAAGEGFVRFSAFNSRKNVIEALGRIEEHARM